MNKTLNFILKAVDKKIASLNDGACFAVFDFDNSCIVNDIADAVFAYLCRNKLLKDYTLLGREKSNNVEYHQLIFRNYYEILGRGDIKKAYTFCAKVLSGFNKREIEIITKQTIHFEGKKIRRAKLYGIDIESGLAIKPQIKELMNVLKKRDIVIWIITASPQVIAETAVRYYGFPCKVVGLKNKAKNGIFTAEIEKPYSILGGKITCIKKFISSNKKPLLAVGDSMSDFPMLKYAMIPVVVDRGNELSQKAKSQGWFTV